MEAIDELAHCPELVSLVRSRRTTGRSGKPFDGLEALSSLNNLVTLGRLMKSLNPDRSLEIGLSFGGSALLFASGHRQLGHSPEKQHIAIDPFQMSVWDACGLDVVERAGLGGFLDFRPSFSSMELPKLLGSARFGLIYVDGSHLFENVFVDAYYGSRLLSDDGVIAFDDSTNPHVKKVLRFLRANCRDGLQELDLAPYRPDEGRSLRYQAARALGRTQMTAFRRVGEVEREWNAPYHAF